MVATSAFVQFVFSRWLLFEHWTGLFDAERKGPRPMALISVLCTLHDITTAPMCSLVCTEAPNDVLRVNLQRQYVASRTT